MAVKSVWLNASSSGEVKFLHLVLSAGSEAPQPNDLLSGEVETVKSLLDAVLSSDVETVKSLLDAVLSSDVETVKSLLGDDVDVNAKIDKKHTLLHYAVSRNVVEIVKLLLDRGADVNATNVHSNTPLHLAVEKGNVEIVKLLLDRGAYVNAKDYIGHVPLNYAVFKGYFNIVKLLLDRGADVNATNEHYKTPLHYAVSSGNVVEIVKIVKLLLDRGADVNAKNRYGQTPLSYASGSSKRYLICRKYYFNYILPTFSLIGIASFIGIVSYIVTGVFHSKKEIENLINSYISYIFLSLIGFGFISAMLMPACSIAPKDCFKSMQTSCDRGTNNDQSESHTKPLL